ncbi:hypothetical protein [Mesorhizobium sp.]|uniref:hypothetical protein n=1 Tax=Mesorhizobium sp. TaxID=1871066 RepID=UPI002580A6C2|nr:hypothetical protein [Mesorhizobium sp.]
MLDGFDLSVGMAEKAWQARVYCHAKGDVDLNGPLSITNASYDITACCGVFTLGHVRPDGLRELARVTRSRLRYHKHPQEARGGNIHCDIVKIGTSFWRRTV